jgi:hypothetical protein
VVLIIRERASTPPFTQEVLIAGILSAAAFAGGVGGMDHGVWRWRRTCTSPPLNTSQRGHADTEEASATPRRSGYGDTSSFGLLKAWDWSPRTTRLTLVSDVPSATSTCLQFAYVL